MQRAFTLIAATAALSGLGVNGSPYRPTGLHSRAMPQISGYDFAGCYTEASSGRALTGSNYFDDHMTIQKCAAACSGFKYFGIEYGRECYCGNTLNTGSVETQLSECSFPCPGDSTSNCGAGNRLSMYIRSVEVTPPAPPTTYSYSGCYAEPAQGRALTGQGTAADDMTVAKCASFCGNAGYSHFGLEYYHECFCGNNLAPGAQSAPEADCRFPCAGDASEKCGGDWRLNLYQFGLPTPGSASSSSSSSAISTPTPSVGVSTYKSEGCYTEASGMRALSDVSFYDDFLTVEKCAAVCSSYTWFGLEYGRECYCGNTINAGSVPTALSDCTFNCPGNSAQRCGAGDRLNLYRYLPAPSSSSSMAVSTSAASSTITSAPIVSSAVPTSSVASSTTAIEDDDDDDTCDDDESETSSLPISTSTTEASSVSSTVVSISAASSTITSAPIASSAVPTSSVVSSTTAAEDDDDDDTCDDDETETSFLSVSTSTTEASSLPSSPSTTGVSSVPASTSAEISSSASASEPSSTSVPSTLSSTSEASAISSSSAISTPEPSTLSSQSSSIGPASISSSSSPSVKSSTSLSSTGELATSTSSPIIESAISSSTSSSSSSNIEAATSTVASTTSTSSSPTSAPSTTSSSSSTEVPTTLTTTTSSSSSTSSSSTSSSSSSSTSSTAAPLPTQAITNGGFENSGGWTIKTSAPGVLTYSFTNPSDPHSGLQTASVSYTAGASAYQAWFSQPITLQPNKRYLFSGWSKASSANPGCSISYYIGTSNGNQNLKTVATITSANLRPNWVQSTGFYDSTTIIDLSMNVRFTCTGAAARTYYIDDLSLTTTP